MSMKGARGEHFCTLLMSIELSLQTQKTLQKLHTLYTLQTVPVSFIIPSVFKCSLSVWIYHQGHCVWIYNRGHQVGKQVLTRIATCLMTEKGISFFLGPRARGIPKDTMKSFTLEMYPLSHKRWRPHYTGHYKDLFKWFQTRHVPTSGSLKI